ncbi:MAG: riboflavin biosynthesis protein RibF, partial [Bacteroidales bacterium]|nr:riboflavin biosynthesis protein RibF [Bacteroidales bacterium]
MDVYTNISEPSFDKVAVTVGVFDGLHLGHQRLLTKLDIEAKRLGVPALVVTFWPHPRLFFHKGDKHFKLLMSLEEKKLKMQELGVKHLLVLPFDQEMADVTGREFIEKFMFGNLHMCHLILGDDHRFGKDRDGSYDLVVDIANNKGFGLTRLETIVDGSSRISSTFIRSCLVAGDLSSANKLLGYPYFILGNVIRGNQLGRRIGFPTANLDCGEMHKQVPQEGVYAVRVELQGREYPGMLNIGTRPTVENYGKKSIEVHLFDINEGLYG